MPTSQRRQSKRWFRIFLETVEWLGNLLPHPVTLFALFAFLVVLFSGLASWLDVSVIDPRPEGANGRSPDGIIRAVSLLNGDGLRTILTGLVHNFVSFVPLGTVLVAMLGVGVAEASGLLSTCIRAIVLKAPGRLITPAVVFAGIMSNTASEMGYVVLVPLAGFIFMALGRHPLAGMAAAFAGVSGGYSANLLIGTVDPLLSGISQEAARFIDPSYVVHAAANWYFMMGSTFIITIAGTWVTAKFVEPQLGEFDPKHSSLEEGEAKSYLKPLTHDEKSGLRWAMLAVVVSCVTVALMVVPEGAVLRNPETGDILRSPFLKGIVALIFIFFLIPSLVFGWRVGSIRNDRDVINGMAKAMSSLGLYIVLVFFAAQFVAFFKQTQFGTILAVTGSEFLKDIGLTGPAIFAPFILMCGFVNLMLGSASAQWAVTAPIFVPMLMQVGYSPEVIQAAYRIGDSTTNIITPMMSYFAMIFTFACRFDSRAGVGTFISMMLPYSIVFMAAWTVFFYVWVFLLGLPVGPGTSIYYGQ